MRVCISSFFTSTTCLVCPPGRTHAYRGSDLDVVEVRVVPVALHDVEEVHEGVVLGVCEAVANLDGHAILVAHPL